MLAELAAQLFETTKSSVKIVTFWNESKDTFKSGVEVTTPGEEPKIHFSPDPLQQTHEESLQSLTQTLQGAAAASDQTILGRTTETSDPTLVAEGYQRIPDGKWTIKKELEE